MEMVLGKLQTKRLTEGETMVSKLLRNKVAGKHGRCPAACLDSIARVAHSASYSSEELDS